MSRQASTPPPVSATRALLLLPTIATTVLFPRVATLREAVPNAITSSAGLVSVLLLGIVPVVLFLAIPGPLLRIGFGADYEGASSFMGILGVAMMIFALVEVYTFHFLALGRLRYPGVLAVGVGLQAFCFRSCTATAEQLVYVQIIVAVVLSCSARSSIASGPRQLAGRRRPPPAGRSGPPESPRVPRSASCCPRSTTRRPCRRRWQPRRARVTRARSTCSASTAARATARARSPRTAGAR